MKFRMMPFLFIHRIDCNLKNMAIVINFVGCIFNLNLCYNYIIIIQLIIFMVHYKYFIIDTHSITNNCLSVNLDKLKITSFNNLEVVYFQNYFEDYINSLKQEEIKQYNWDWQVKMNFNIQEVKINNLIKLNLQLTKRRLLKMVVKLMINCYNQNLIILNILIFMVRVDKFLYHFNINYLKNPIFKVKEQYYKDFEFIEHRYFNYYSCFKLSIIIIMVINMDSMMIIMINNMDSVMIINMDSIMTINMDSIKIIMAIDMDSMKIIIVIDIYSIKIMIFNTMNQSYFIIDSSMTNMDLILVVKNHIMKLHLQIEVEPKDKLRHHKDEK